MVKILFIHNTIMWYRKPFFKKISSIYDIKFIFTDIDSSESIYGVKVQKKVDGLEDVNYKFLKNYWGIAFSIIKDSLGEYDVIVGGNWDSFSLLIETLIYFFICKIRRKKFILWRENWHYWIENLTIKKKISLPIIKYLIKSSDAILVPGKKHKEFFKDLGAKSKKIFIMPNVSSTRAHENSLKISNEIKNKYKIQNKKVLFYVGRLIKRKGVDYLINALSDISKERNDVVLIIAGRGECEKYLKKLAKDQGVLNKIFFVGYISNKELASYYLLCDICIVPSINYKMADPAPLVVNEAMSFGRPVIATDAVGCAFDLIKNNYNGFIIPQKDHNAISTAINIIISNPVLENEMRENSKKIIETGFMYNNMVKEFGNAVEYAISDKNCD